MSNIESRLQSVLNIHATNITLWYNCVGIIWCNVMMPCNVMVWYQTSGQSNLTSGCIAAADGHFSCISQLGAFPWGHIGATLQIRLNLCLLQPTRVHNINSISIGSAIFAQMTAECPYTIGRPFPPQNCPFPWGIWTPSNTWFLGPPDASTQMASRSVQPFLQGSLVWQTDRQTDHATQMVIMGHIYICSTAIRPNITLCCNHAHIMGDMVRHNGRV